MKNVTFYKFDIEPENNLRLDQIISSRLPEYSRSTIKNWINAEKILVNGKTCSPKDKISVKSEIEIEVYPNEEIDIIPALGTFLNSGDLNNKAFCNVPE